MYFYGDYVENGSQTAKPVRERVREWERACERENLCVCVRVRAAQVA